MLTFVFPLAGPAAVGVEVLGFPITTLALGPSAIGLVAVFGVIAYAANRNKTDSGIAEPGASHNPNDPDDAEEPGASHNPNDPDDAELRVSPRKVNKLLEKPGDYLHKKSVQKIQPGARNGTVAEKDGVRVDIGHQHDGKRNYEIQINRIDDRSSQVAKSILKNDLGGNTHKPVFKGVWDMNNPPSLAEWKNQITTAKRAK